jgi:hypothetical protein
MFHKIMVPVAIVGFALLFGLFAGGCTVNYELNTVPISKWPDHVKVPLKVNLVLSDPFRAYVFDKANFEGDHFKYPLGKVFAVNSQAMAEAGFDQVTVVAPSAPAAGVDAILTPEIGLVDRSTSAWAFDPVDMTADLKWTVTDPSGRVVWVKTVRGISKHALGNAFNHSAYAKEHVNLTMIDLFSKSLMELTTAPEIRQLVPPPPPSVGSTNQ